MSGEEVLLARFTGGNSVIPQGGNMPEVTFTWMPWKFQVLSPAHSCRLIWVDVGRVVTETQTGLSKKEVDYS